MKKVTNVNDRSAPILESESELHRLANRQDPRVGLETRPGCHFYCWILGGSFVLGYSVTVFSFVLLNALEISF